MRIGGLLATAVAACVMAAPEAVEAGSALVGACGRQGMVASQRFPGRFDGIVAGAPGFNLPRAAVAEARACLQRADVSGVRSHIG